MFELGFIRPDQILKKIYIYSTSFKGPFHTCSTIWFSSSVCLYNFFKDDFAQNGVQNENLKKREKQSFIQKKEQHKNPSKVEARVISPHQSQEGFLLTTFSLWYQTSHKPLSSGAYILIDSTLSMGPVTLPSFYNWTNPGSLGSSPCCCWLT